MLIPAHFVILRVRADWEVLHSFVHIDLFLVVDGGPQRMHTKCLAVSRWDVVIVKSERSEVVLSVIEDVIRLVLGALGLVDVVHENDVLFGIGTGHYFHEGPDI